MQALAAHGSLNIRQLALKVMAAKGLDTGDKVLEGRCWPSHSCVALASRRGFIDGMEKRLDTRAWTLPKCARSVQARYGKAKPTRAHGMGRGPCLNERSRVCLFVTDAVHFMCGMQLIP